MRYDFLVQSYETERIKVLSVWSEFKDEDLHVRPKRDDPRGRSVLEHMIHQCVSEDTWFRGLGIDVAAPPLPRRETRRLTHISHHRGQQVAMLRMLGRRLHSNYGPTADTGGLMQDHAPTIYAYPDVQALLDGEDRGGAKSPLPEPKGTAVTERPD